MGKYAYIFGGRVDYLLVEFLHGDPFPYGGMFPKGEFFRGNLPKLLYKILLMSCSLLVDTSTRGDVKGTSVRCKFSPGLNCLENKSLGRRDFSVEEWQNFLELLKNDQKLNKIKLSHLKVRSNMKT